MTTRSIHGSCIVLDQAALPFGAPADAGVLILGESGSGKSDLVLRLIERGAVLVADDRVELFCAGGNLWGRAPKRLAGLFEVRGVGIVALPFRGEAAIALAIALQDQDGISRLPERDTFRPPDGLALPSADWPPLVRLCSRESSAPAKLVAAAAAYACSLFREQCNPS